MQTRLRRLIPGLALALTGACAFAPLAGQAADVVRRVAPAFGNTVLSTYPDGRSQKIWLRPDGTWEGASRRGNPLAGKWSIKGEKLCLKQTKPAMPLSFCVAYPGEAQVGAVWTSKDLAGTPIKLKVVKGIVGAKAGT